MALPVLVYTPMLPLEPSPTTALIIDEDTGITAVAHTLPNMTVLDSRPVPVMVTVSPVLAAVGVNERIVGNHLKLDARLAVP